MLHGIFQLTFTTFTTWQWQWQWHTFPYRQVRKKPGSAFTRFYHYISVQLFPLSITRHMCIDKRCPLLPWTEHALPISLVSLSLHYIPLPASYMNPALLPPPSLPLSLARQERNSLNKCTKSNANHKAKGVIIKQNFPCDTFHDK